MTLHARRSALIRTLRLALVRSNVGPARVMYAACYRAAAQAAVVLLRMRWPGGVSCVCLRGSASSHVLVPGVSDVDLFVVLRDEVGVDGHEAIQRWYARLAAICPLLDPHPWLLRWHDVETLYRENPSFRFRVFEGQQAFRTLYGTSRLGGLPALSRTETLLAHVFDLKSKLTYFNAFCLHDTDDALDEVRAEYMLFKLTLDFVRLAQTFGGGPDQFDRAVLCRQYVDGTLHLEKGLGIGDDAPLREFVAFVERNRLRRRFFRVSGGSRDRIEARVLRAGLELCVACWAHEDLGACDLLAVEHEHFYADGRFTPTDHPVRELPSDCLDDLAGVRQTIAEARAGGWHAVVPYKGLRVNLSHRTPGLGHCSVVSWPEQRR
jgi:hypothetical protein